MFKVYQAGKRYLIKSSYDHEQERTINKFFNVGDSRIIEQFPSIDLAKAYCINRLENDPTLTFYIEGPDKVIEETIMDEKVRADIGKRENRRLAWKIAITASVIIGIAFYLLATFTMVTCGEALIGWSVLNGIYILLMLFYGARSILEVTVMIVIMAVLGGIICSRFTGALSPLF